MLQPPEPIRDKTSRRRMALAVAFILLVSAAVRLWQVSIPAEYMFDEVYYAKDAKAIVDGRIGPKAPLLWEAGDEVSWPHPEMGKLAIALGIIVFGDRAFGWRLPAVLAGLAMLACVYPLGRRLGLPPPWALIALLFAAADTLGIAQSRIATLDIFIAVWSVLCIYLALRYVQDGRRMRWLLLCALAGGMAVGTKWSGGLAILAAGVILVLAWLRDRHAAAESIALHADEDRRDTVADTPGDVPAAECAGAAPGARDASTLGPAAGPRAPTSLVAVLPHALLAAAILILIPAAVYMLSYTDYFLHHHTWSQWVELQRQAEYFSLHLKAGHTYASPAYSWILDIRPVWYYFQGGTTYRGVVAIGNPFLWWVATLSLIAAAVLAVRRSLLLAPTAIIVVLLYLPWLATSRTSFLYYMTPVAPFLAILAAGGLLLFAGTADLPRRGALILAGVAVATAVLWDPVGRLFSWIFWGLPSRVSPTFGWVGVGIGIFLALLVVVLLLSPRMRAWRPVVSMVLAGAIIGICVAFIPVVLNIPISPGHFSHITWFQSWI